MREHDLTDLMSRFREIEEGVIRNINDAREKVLERWLLARGWDGKDMDKAREMAAGYTVAETWERDRVIFEVVKADTCRIIEREPGTFFYEDFGHNLRINLTEMFGKGREPRTVREFHGKVPLEYLRYPEDR